jgi:hypothetical protein
MRQLSSHSGTKRSGCVEVLIKIVGGNRLFGRLEYLKVGSIAFDLALLYIYEGEQHSYSAIVIIRTIEH